MTDLTLAICVYNAEKYIKETLTSVMQQTMQNFNLLIVNDCSTDRSVDMIEEFFTENPREHEMVSFEENRGLSAGRRYVEEHAKTKYIMFVDADDSPYPTLVEKLHKKITSDNDLMAVGCYLEYIDENGKKIGGGIFIGEKSKEDFYKKAENEKLVFMQPTAIYDREVALKVGGHSLSGFPAGKPRYRDLCEDLDLWTRMSDLYKEGKAIVVVPEVLCRYRKHEKAMSANSLGMFLRMRHIKTNLKRRRAGKEELTFIDFYNSIEEKQLKELKKDAAAANALRSGAFLLQRGKIVKGMWEVIKSLYHRPGYILEKIKHHSGIGK